MFDDELSEVTAEEAVELAMQERIEAYAEAHGNPDHLLERAVGLPPWSGASLPDLVAEIEALEAAE
jgi:hypothetical protein